GPRPRAEVATGPDGTPVFVTVPALSAAPLQPARPPAPVTVTDRVLDNGIVRVELDPDGLFAAVRDLAAGREVLAAGSRGNLLQLHPDLPSHWDAWDVGRHYRRVWTDLTTVDSIEVVEAGPLVGAVRVERSFGASRISQTVYLRAGSARIEVATDLDWHEREKILKVAFPLDVHADRTAAEIQFGHVFRPTHTNTSWDAARFEVYAHRWIHAGEPGYGVALLTDSTYGYDATRGLNPGGGVMTSVRLSLVRAPRSPDPHADQGRHRFRYALLPGAGIAEAVGEAYALNLPLRITPGAGTPPGALVTVDSPAVAVESVKLADDRSGDVVVRLYESLGGRATARLRPGFALAGACLTDLLERPLPHGALAAGPDGALALALRPFQVVTLRLARVS
ncbi:MAG TPA: glycoside hydrolase family 38 C-terminal domain-containing protein, partial [Rugosimonospora sp.]|nr:glycoside hydrolase family 38 C-terminal domain-containing protein [Rugosimonospora sp.]